MELSDIILPHEQKQLDSAAARAKKAGDALLLADIRNLAEETKASAAGVTAAEEELEAAKAAEDALVESFKPRFVALARKMLLASLR